MSRVTARGSFFSFNNEEGVAILLLLVAAWLVGGLLLTSDLSSGDGNRAQMCPTALRVERIVLRHSNEIPVFGLTLS
jgi:hypothetical protein